MNNEQKSELIALVEKGAKANVNFFGSVFFEYEERISAGMWGFALIGKFGDPATAVAKFKEIRMNLPESNPGCMQDMYAVAQLLGLDWKELMDLHYAHKSPWHVREDEVREFKKLVPYVHQIVWARDVLQAPMHHYEGLIAEQLTPAS